MYDMLIIGGGINGVGIARDAAGRGLKVLLCEKHDLAAATSSNSSKLIHGGLRYLENYEFRLVRESLGERETLLNIAPHIIWPLRFVLPVLEGMRPSWMLRVGLFIYDHLTKRSFLPATKTLKLRDCLQGAPLKPEMRIGFEYSDCWADDSRLVVLNAMDAAAHGADILTRTDCTKLERRQDRWVASLSTGGAQRQIEARTLVNAAGPWVEEVQAKFGQRSNSRGIRLVKGSHIVTRRLFEGDHAYIFQSADGRVIFVIPYEEDYTLIGTTEVDWDINQGEVKISQDEIDYLRGEVARYFKTPVTADDIVWTYAGVRPLFDDKSESASVVTRDYVFDLDAGNDNAAPVLSIFGGKLTTYRMLAQHAMEKLAPYFEGLQPAWTHSAPLPGGDFSAADYQALVAKHAAQYAWMPAQIVARMTRAYGTRMPFVIGAAASLEDLGPHFGAGLYAAEVTYLQTHEFAQTADDVLWRRSKLGLRVSGKGKSDLEAWQSIRQAA
jgi:glycerol-3-phosphate dehydrogenase